MRVITASSHGGPEVLRVEERPAPQAQADDVVVEVKEAGVNRIDIYARRGMLGMFSARHTPTRSPTCSFESCPRHSGSSRQSFQELPEGPLLRLFVVGLFEARASNQQTVVTCVLASEASTRPSASDELERRLAALEQVPPRPLGGKLLEHQRAGRVATSGPLPGSAE
jgi:hypothetical protein